MFLARLFSAMGESDRRRRLWFGQVVAGFVLLILSVVIFVAAGSFSGASRIYPGMISSILFVCCVVNLVSLLGRRLGLIGDGAHDQGQDNVQALDDSGTELMDPRRGAIYLGTIAVFVLSFSLAPYSIGAAVAGVVILRFVYKQGWKTSILGAVFLSAASSAVFMAMGVNLPGPGV